MACRPSTAGRRAHPGHAAFDAFDLFSRYTGTLVCDDYAGYDTHEEILTARQLCNAHLIPSVRGVAEAEPGLQARATAMIEVLRAGRSAVRAALAEGRTCLTGGEIEQVRAAYLEQAAAGIAANKDRCTTKGGRHPGYVLAKRLHAIPPMHAIRTALAGNAWTPLRAVTTT
ncbi:IS66 family transposase [Frankia sp. Cr1]|uniref:IS66 family transposase n=1 Tax=Frankia sp. Cr1 TaxID=3073931 RepID=UPI002AD392EE|nr:transposase [Frankia sp. Cr1]